MLTLPVAKPQSRRVPNPDERGLPRSDAATAWSRPGTKTRQCRGCAAKVSARQIARRSGFEGSLAALEFFFVDLAAREPIAQDVDRVAAPAPAGSMTAV